MAVLEILNEGFESSKPFYLSGKIFSKNKIKLQNSKINLNKFDNSF